MYDFYKTNNSALCDYSRSPDTYLTDDPSGVCPKLPSLETLVALKNILCFYVLCVMWLCGFMFWHRAPVLSRCVPTSLPQFLTDLTIYVSNLQTINLILGDIYVSRYAIMGLCFLAVCK